jgi:N-acylneuraminate cytidylyltransferase/CMP-N,N'-diacetyllegionaminic acid synthase
VPERSLLVLVPARGGSKGLHRKNARLLGDIPLIEWTARAVRATALGDQATVILSTDDSEIAEIGRACGLETPFVRPTQLATDAASVVDVALHAIEWMEKQRGLVHQSLMLLQPTSPFRPPRALREALEVYSSSGAAGVVGMKALHRSLTTLFRQAEDGSLVALDETTEVVTRRQDAGSILTPNGALYLVACSVLRRARTFFPRPLRGLLMDPIASLDIDDPSDWSIAEAVARAGLTWRDQT